MADETSSLLDRPGSDAESPLAAAARHLRATPIPIGAVSARQREVLRGRQVRDLLAWARENSALIDPTAYVHVAKQGGMEHRIWPSADNHRIFKATFPVACGFTVLAAEVTSSLPELVKALPLEYLERLLLQNKVFGDDIRLEGVASETEGMVVVSSQSTLIGEPPEKSEILDFMRGLWFQPLPELHLGNPGALAFYRDLDEVAAFDAHPANFVKDDNGVVLPIDLILVQADKSLHTTLSRYLM